MKKINKFVLSACPFCSCKLWYAEAFVAKNKPLYKCKCCKKVSEVKIKSKAFSFVSIAAILSVIIFSVFLLMGSGFSFLGIGLIIFVFLVCYGLLPFAVDLVYPRKEESSFLKEDWSETEEHKLKKSGLDTETDIYSN